MKNIYKVPLLILITFGIWNVKNFLFFSLYNLERIEFEIGDEKIDDFGYWLDDIDKDDIEDSNYDLIIMDYSADGTQSEEFTKEDVEDMKSSGKSEKLLFAYISIGEAEDYRFYWNISWVPGSPIWLDEENPDWEGNYKIKFWMKGWQDIIYDYLDHIIIAGFDGIYMDIIDAYEYYETKISHSDWLMIDFVVNISRYVQSRMGNDFAVFAQNGEELLSNSTYLRCIDGIGREDVFFDDNEETEEDERDDIIDDLNKALDEEKTVLIIDYPSTEYYYDFYKLSIENGFLPYASERDLDYLNEFMFYPAT